MNKDSVRDYVIQWNSRFPVDRWWRKKYNKSFNSLDHRKSSFLDQLIEYEEDILFRELQEESEYIPGSGDWLRERVPQTIEEDIKSLRDEFKDVD